MELSGHRPSCADFPPGDTTLIRFAQFSAAAIAAVLLGAPHSAAESQWVRTGATGRLIYVPDAEGDRILDFSRVGYQGRGTQLIPNDVPNAVVISPIAGDDTANIQAAINAVAALPIVDGFRGAVLLAAGHYDIGAQLTIGASGIVLRGVGRETSDTVLHGRGTDQRPLIQVLGAGSPSFSGNPKRNMIDKVVPAGATSFRVDSVSGLDVGDTVRVERPSTAEWIAAIGMDVPLDDDPAWEPGTMNVRYDRTITRIEGNRVFLDAPLASSFELQYGGGTIQSYNWVQRIENIGIEDLRAESDFTAADDEDHAWEFVSISSAQNVWVRRTTSQYFGDSAVVSNPTAKWVTVEDAVNLDPVSIVTGERRYTFDLSGQLDLVTNSDANSGRHDFVNNSTRPPGPHVFHNSVAHNALNDTGPHQRWATGTLFDNIVVEGDNINARNRGSFGTRHGWSGANMVVWNSTADGFIVQNPPTAQNWLIGSTGAIIDDTTFGPQPGGYVDSHGTPVTVGGTNSLYEAQMNDSADIREFHWRGGEANWNDDIQWQQGVRPGVYRVVVRDYLIGDIDGYAFDGSNSEDAAYIDPAWEAAIASASALPISGFDDLSGNENVAFTIEHELDAGERVVHGYLVLALRQSASSNVSSDFVRLFDMEPAHRIDFSDVGWDSEINQADTFVGVVDLGVFLDQLQNGSVNVQLNDDTGVDWASYVVTVAMPANDPIGPAVYLDGGGTATIDSAVAGIGSLEVGGAAGGGLRIEPAGTLELSGDYVQLASGSLTLALSGSAMADAPIQIDDEAQLAGTLIVESAIGFMPTVDAEFELLAALGGVTGEFDDVSLPPLPSGLAWDLSYAATAVLLKITSVLPGDYNGDGLVNAADYVVWRKQNAPQEGYDTWRDHFGNSLSGGGAATAERVNGAVPEASAAMLSIIAAVGLFLRRGDPPLGYSCAASVK
jgi:hypothetical protein